MTTLGIVADTHIPERMKRLPDLTRLFRGVDGILHAGDISRPRVLDELARIAPVHAVSGNRDWYRGRPPLDVRLEFDGVRLALTHGHGGWWNYLKEKLLYVTTGYQLERYYRLLRARFQDVDVVVFGHSHRPINEWSNGVLMFNPGPLGPTYYRPYDGPTVGKLYLEAGSVRGEIVQVKGLGS